jgi:hypothetical protein
MPLFVAQEAQKGSALLGLGSIYRGVELAFQPGHLRMVGQTYALTKALATEQEICDAVKALIADLEAAEIEAKQMLKDRAGRSP